MVAELLQFLLKHWVLSAALLITLVLLFWEESKNKTGGSRLSLADATNLINRERATLIDVRENSAFVEGHIVNALSFPAADIMNQLEKLRKYRDKPIILVDKKGQETNHIGHQLRKQGFSKVYSLAGGLQTWLDAGLPLTKKGVKP